MQPLALFEQLQEQKRRQLTPSLGSIKQLSKGSLGNLKTKTIFWS
jgi:hypothetical protein